MFASASTFVSRLSEVEKSKIRAATTPDRLDWLFYVKHRFELVGTDEQARSTFDEAVSLVKIAFAEMSKSNHFGRTWTF